MAVEWSVDLDGATFDSIDTGGATQKVRTSYQHLARVRQSNARLPALNDYFLLSAQNETLVIELDFTLRGRSRGFLKQAHDDWH